MASLREIMSKDTFGVAPDAAVAEAAQSMVKRRLGSALVMQGAMLVGILTERDVLRAAASGRDLTATPVSEWMTPDPETAGPDTGASDAAELMLSRGFRHLPVVDGNTVTGIVSLRDLLSANVRRATR
jgi:CBS domain-containing protein